ncbi:hypothetical protein [Solirubrum puertoriconensis]|uniref:Uncharacterized protein n=1 Tax=Solirubrum puertoriconensis TaxID=1751427 RepID=A0A9X0HIK2_SOLP1|nr:hypothetical protein [Solirubrum puertoriconensis]KUG06520.1 hypothetical protein ASU33_03980 [Solirubrum puertoriconensis]
MRTRFFGYLLLLALPLAGCEKLDFGDDGGITRTDAQGRTTGRTDSSEWTTDLSWDKQERELFKDLSFAIDGPNSPRLSNARFVLYPNPAPKFANFAADFQPNGPVRPRIRYVLVDKRYRVMQTGTLRSENSVSGAAGLLLDFALVLDAPKLDKGKTYRLYYVMYNEEHSGALGYLCKGHGDVELAK